MSLWYCFADGRTTTAAVRIVGLDVDQTPFAGAPPRGRIGLHAADAECMVRFFCMIWLDPDQQPMAGEVL
jgi:hypothetical protein